MCGRSDKLTSSRQRQGHLDKRESFRTRKGVDGDDGDNDRGDAGDGGNGGGPVTMAMMAVSIGHSGNDSVLVVCCNEYIDSLLSRPNHSSKLSLYLFVSHETHQLHISP